MTAEDDYNWFGYAASDESDDCQSPFLRAPNWSSCERVHTTFIVRRLIGPLNPYHYTYQVYSLASC